MRRSEQRIVRELAALAADRYSPLNHKLQKGIGDDCAIVHASGAHTVCVDTLVRGVHYPENGIDYTALAFKSVAVNVSDTIATGAVPRWFTVALTAADSFDFEAFYAGIEQACRYYDIALIGGDTCRGSESVSVTMLGEVQAAVLRSGARPGDKIMITGVLGAAASALAQLRQGKTLSKPLYEAYWRPKPQLKWLAMICEYATAAIDISDGLLQDLGHILEQSGGLGARLHTSYFTEWKKLEQLTGADEEQVWQWILNGGDDYHVCFTVPSRRFKELEEVIQSGDCAARLIGEVTGEGGVFVDGRSRISAGYQHWF